MSAKTPISALQELMAAKKFPLPIYIEEGFDTSFTCTVHAGGVTAVGFSTSKKNAKHESAKNALAKLTTTSPHNIVALTMPSFVPEPKISKNYVGYLNEYASKHSFRYPEYRYLTVTDTGEFHFECSFLGKEGHGKGLNKKGAKQDAAKKMLELIQAMDTLSIRDTYKIMQTNNITEFGIDNHERVISLYNALSLQDSAASSTKKDSITANPEINTFEDENVEVLKKKLRQHDINYTLSQLQSHPYVTCVKIKNTELHFIQSDQNREEAIRKVLQDVLEARKSGCSLDTNDLINLG